MRNARIATHVLLINLIAVRAFAQVTLTDPPDTTPSRGLSATGQYALSQIESVNASTGDVSLSIPLAHLPPGPAGFSAGVNLIYNSTLYDIEVEVPGTLQQYRYISSVHGGGWNYGYRYTLWTQRRFAQDFDLSAQCNAIGSTSAAAWFKNYLKTPDGSNHVLNLVAIIQNGQTTSPPPTSIERDPNDAYWKYDFGGNTTQSCLSSLFRGQQAPGFQGTLVFATSDSTYIRIEATVSGGTGSWVAYLPDGTQVTGASINSTVGHVNDSDGTQVTDRNGNTLALTGGCPNGGACTEYLTDSQSRSISVQYAAGAASICQDLGSVGSAWTDTITWPGVNGNLTTNVNWACTAPDASINYYNLVNPDGSTYTSSTMNLQSNLNPLPAVVTSLQLPAAASGGPFTSFTFGYGSWDEVHSLAMSSGGTQQYSATYTYCYDVGIGCSLVTYPRPPATAVNPIKTKVLQYNELRDGSNSVPISETTSYSILGPSNAFTYPLTGTVGQITNPDGSYTLIYTANLCPSGFTSRDFCPALPYKIANSDGSQTEMGWAWNTSPPGGVPGSAVFNPYVQFRAFTAGPSGSATKETYFAQDQNGNATTIGEYDWIPFANVPRGGSPNVVNGVACPSPGAPNAGQPCPLRTTTSTYYEQSGPAYWDHSAPRNLRAKQNAVVGNVTSVYTYDAPLTTANLTQLQQYDSLTSITSHWTYLGNGNVSSMTDPNGNLTAICYDANLYPIAKVIAAQDTSCPNPAAYAEGQKTTYNFDFNSGLFISGTDADNSVTTSNTAYDNLGRLKTSTQTSSSLTRTTSTSYDDANLGVTTTSDDTGTSSLVTTAYQDALGRMRYAVDGAGNKVQKAYRYGSSGSFLVYELESNPYNGGSSDSQTMGWTLTTRNLSTLTATVQHFAGSTLPAPWGSNSTVTGTASAADGVIDSSCAGPVTTVTDEAGNQRKNCADALGRLVSVTEPNGTVTTYTYDTLDNLLTVDMSGQPTVTCPDNSQHMRCFSYTLSRLRSATNPENGSTITYSYDNNGNVTQQSQSGGTTITFSPYDKLNRLLSKTYAVTDQAAPQQVCYVYDTGGFKGALTSAGTLQSGTCSSPTYSTKTSYTYDTFGRISSSTQNTNGAPYTFSYGYSLTDELTDVTYPSGRHIQYGLDAADRVTSVKNVATGTNYATLSYTAPGGIYTMSMGNGLTEQVNWNDRSQPVQMQATKSGNARLTLGFYPCSALATQCTSGNNGSLQGQTISVPGMSLLTQTYGYDSLSRLTSAQETGPSGWSQSYGYDARGNRWLSGNSGLAQGQTLETPIASTWYSNSPVINRVNGWGYDSAGNVTQIYGMTRSFSYDGENRQVSATINSNTSTYTYDGLGQRVMKVSGGQTTVYAYDAFGSLAAEYSTQSAVSQCGTNTCYVTVDHLGSTRMLTDSDGNAAKLYDYLPFGEELLANQDGRSSLYSSTPDGLGPKFTGQVWDGETSLSWFNVRHMSGAQGRFQGVDPGNAGANPADPQTWNMYAYVGNNPLTYTDPNGMGFWSTLFNITLDIGKVLFDISTFGQGSRIWSGGGIGGITACGGPLGNCGGFGSDPWSENSGLGNVQDPGRFIFTERPADQGVVDYNVENFIAGLADSLSFGWTRNTRTKRGLQQADFCSGAYQAGEMTPVVAGGLRLAYAGAARAIPLIVGGSTEGALDAVAVRNSLKVLFRSPVSWFSSTVRNYRIYDPAVTVATRGASGAIAGAAKTNGPLNRWGAVLLAGGATSSVTQPSTCR